MEFPAGPGRWRWSNGNRYLALGATFLWTPRRPLLCRCLTTRSEGCHPTHPQFQVCCPPWTCTGHSVCVCYFTPVAKVTDSLERCKVSRPSLVHAVTQTPLPRALESGPGWCPNSKHCCCGQLFPQPHTGLPMVVIASCATCVLVSGPMDTNPEDVSDEVESAHGTSSCRCRHDLGFVSWHRETNTV